MILKNLWGRKTRTFLTLFGIAIGVAAVVALNALGDGFIQGYTAMSGGSGADLLVTQADSIDVMFSAVDATLGDALAGLPNVTQISGMVYTFAATDAVPYFIVYGYAPDSFAIEKFKIIAGEPLSRRGATGRSGKPLLLGRRAATDLKKQVGDSLRLYEGVFRIVGVYETGQPFEDGAAVILLEDAQALAGKARQVNAFLLKVRPETDLAALQARIEARFPKLTASTSAGFAADQDMLKYMYAYTWGISLIAVLIGGVGVMNTMMMSVFERTREFGVLRAVGWRSRQVLGLVLGESLVVGLIGGGVGILLGVLSVKGVEHVPAVSAMMPGKLSPWLFGQGIAVAVGLGLLGGGAPAWRAAQLLPAEAMRVESGASSRARKVPGALWRTLLRQPIRTGLTVVGIGIALMAMVLLGAMSAGMVEAFSGMMGSMGAQLIGVQANASVDLSQIDESSVRRIAGLPGVRAAEGFLTGYTALGDLPFFIVYGYPPRGLGIREFQIVEGAPLSGNRQVILGRVAAQNLNKQVGQNLRIFDSAFKIVGIFETGVPMQDGGCVLTLRDAQNLFGQPRKVSFMGVWLEDPRQVAAVRQAAAVRFPEVALSLAAEFTEDLTDFQMMEGMTWGIALMALFVGGLGMTNTMVMSVYERTREIGVLRALGWRRRRVLGMIVRESVALSLLGAAAGTLTGVALGYVLNALPVMQGFFTMRYSPGLFGQALLTAVLLGVVGGVYPAWRAANLPPVEALRYE